MQWWESSGSHCFPSGTTFVRFPHPQTYHCVLDLETSVIHHSQEYGDPFRHLISSECYQFISPFCRTQIGCRYLEIFHTSSKVLVFHLLWCVNSLFTAFYKYRNTRCIYTLFLTSPIGKSSANDTIGCSVRGVRRRQTRRQSQRCKDRVTTMCDGGA